MKKKKPSPNVPDFIIENHLQRLEVWAAIKRPGGSTAAEIKRTADNYASAILVPVCGQAVQKIGTAGFDADGFMLQTGVFRFSARQDLQRAVVSGFLPAQHGKDVEITAACAGSACAQTFTPGTSFTLELPLRIPKDSEHEFRISLSSAYQPSALPGESSDTRNLGCILYAIDFS